MAKIPEKFKDLLDGAVVVSLASINPDGTIQVNPVWCSWADNLLWVNTARGRRKDDNLSNRPTVTVLATDPKNPYRYLEIRGEVVSGTEDGADEHIDDLAELYMNQRPYPYRKEGEIRVIYKIRPTRTTSFP